MPPLKVVGQNIVDSKGRNVKLRGINLSGDSKLPAHPYVPSHSSEHYWESDTVSFVDRPFSLDVADEHLARIRSWGYNTIRYIITWEAIEHERPGSYDDDYISYVIKMLEMCGRHGLHVVIDPHQDCWSRYSGGSGAPFWTFVAAGMNPEHFATTEAAIVHNTSQDPQKFPSMIWSTNYDRLASATMFVLFFAGKRFAPKAIINGINIQDYLQSHFIGAIQHLARRLAVNKYLVTDVIVGWESLNEPSRGYIGLADISVISSEQRLRKGTCPTPFQSMLLGSGIAQRIDTYEFSHTGPRKAGSVDVDPKGVSIWCEQAGKDEKYGFKRDPAWKTGTCIWALHGVWEESTQSILDTAYFSFSSRPEQDPFLNEYFMSHFRSYKQALRSVYTGAILFCQPPVLSLPPTFTAADRADSQIVYSPHFYDGLTLITKNWYNLPSLYQSSRYRNKFYNVDVLGILRGRYSLPIFAVRFGERAIRNCLRDQLIAIKQEGLEFMGPYPCFLSEIGVPFDMNDGLSYKTGDYSGQIHALDANNYALEGANNQHDWGDFWNGEDLSFWSRDHLPLMESDDISSLSINKYTQNYEDGCRAFEAFLRPSPVAVWGDVVTTSFDLNSKKFYMKIQWCDRIRHPAPTVIFVPVFHYPWGVEIKASSGRVEMDSDRQLLNWWYEPGDQTIELKPISKPTGSKRHASLLSTIWQICK